MAAAALPLPSGCVGSPSPPSRRGGGGGEGALSPSPSLPPRPRKPLLRHPSELRTLGFVSVFYGCLLSLWWYDTAMLSSGPVGWIAFAFFYATLLLFSAVLAVITHNALHVPVFHSVALQKVFQLLLTVAYGQPCSVYQPAHNRSHHRHTGTRQDLMRSTKLQYRWNFLNIALSKEHAPGPTRCGVEP